MTQWEYAYLQAKGFADYSGGGWPKQYLECTFCGVTGSSQPVRASSVISILNELGKDGWEAFHIEAIQAGSIYWLKRPASP